MDAPWYKSQTFAALLLTLVTFLCNAIGRKWGVELNATEIAGFIATVVAFIAGRQYKSTRLAVESIRAEADAAAFAEPAPANPAAALAQALK
jgi:hypothetical protein